MILNKQRILAAFKTGAAPLVLGAVLIASPAYAQTADSVAAQADPAAEAPATGTQTPVATANQAQDIVVTGSRITNPNLVQSSQVAVIGGDEITFQQPASAEELVGNIPGVAAGINSGVNNGSFGYASFNLRHLGDNRNLVLIDGSRIVPASLTGVTDLNNIPLALVERVDVLTGGASSVYGADAVAGVVNFITKKDFSGVDITGTSGITERGDGKRYRVDLTAGTNLADGRGNAVISIGYQKVNPVLQSDRKISQTALDTDGSVVGSGTSIPTRINGDQYDPATGTLVPTYNTFNFAPYNYFQTPMERFNIFGSAHYEVADNIEVYSKAMFNKTTVKLRLAPSGLFGDTYQLPLNNPFLTDSIRGDLCAYNKIADCADATAKGTEVPTTINRRLVEVGPRETDYTTNQFQLWTGVRGDITDRIKFDVSGTYGESKIDQVNRNTGLKSRVQQALRASDQNTCIDNTNGCTPINLFGDGQSISPETVAFINAPSLSSVKTTLAVLNATVSGDLTDQGFLFADTPIGFSLGSEYRKYTAEQQSDAASATQDEVLGAGAPLPNFRGSYNVWELFGETIVPIVENVPGIYNLTFEGGARYSHYSTAGGTFTWKAGGSYEPVAGVRFRGLYAHAVRAPNISELYLPVTIGLDNASDPCAGSSPVGNAALTALCVAQGAPAGRIGSIPQPSAGQINVTSGGNADLGPETANTYTLGLVLTPDLLSGFSASADYFHIKVTDAITYQKAQGDILDRCFGSTAPYANPPGGDTCSAIQRNPLNGSLNGGSDTPGVILDLTNQGTIETSGIDVALGYKLPTSFGSLNWAFQGTWTKEYKFQATPTSLNRDCIGQYGSDCDPILPEYQFNTRLTADLRDAGQLSLRWRWLDKVEYQNQADPEVLDAYKSIPAYSYFDLSYSVNATDKFTFTATVDNLFDKKPPVTSSYVGTTSYNSGNTYPATYDVLGRMFTITVGMHL